MREWPQPNENKQQVAAVASTLFMTFVYISPHRAANFVQSSRLPILPCRFAISATATGYGGGAETLGRLGKASSMSKRAPRPMLAIKPIVTFVVLCAIVALAIVAGRLVRYTYTPSQDMDVGTSTLVPLAPTSSAAP